MKEYILIVVAMDSELNEIRKNMNITETLKFSNTEYYVGTYNKENVILALSGIGKVNSAIMTTHILTKYNVKYCISIGIAGGVKANIGDFILVNKSYYGDFDLRPFGYPLCKVPGVEEFTTKDFMLDELVNICKDNNIEYKIGSSFTMDKFVTSLSQVEEIKDDVRCIEMESNSILHACMSFNTNCIIIRVISDVVGVTSNENYLEFEQKSSVILNDFLSKLIK